MAHVGLDHFLELEHLLSDILLFNFGFELTHIVSEVEFPEEFDQFATVDVFLLCMLQRNHIAVEEGLPDNLIEEGFLILFEVGAHDELRTDLLQVGFSAHRIDGHEFLQRHQFLRVGDLLHGRSFFDDVRLRP